MTLPAQHLLRAAFLAALALTAPGLAQDAGANDTLALERNYPGEARWKIELVQGQGAQDRIAVVDAIAPFKVRGLLRKPGDSCELTVALARLVFSPNLPRDGTSYVVKISDSLSACERCKRPQKDQFVTVKVEKPASTTLSVKALRRVSLSPDWRAPNHLAPSPVETRAEQEERITRFFTGRTLKFDQAYF